MNTWRRSGGEDGCGTARRITVTSSGALTWAVSWACEAPSPVNDAEQTSVRLTPAIPSVATA